MRSLVVFLVVAVASVFVVACGGGDPTSQERSAPAPVAQEERAGQERDPEPPTRTTVAPEVQPEPQEEQRPPAEPVAEVQPDETAEAADRTLDQQEGTVEPDFAEDATAEDGAPEGDKAGDVASVVDRDGVVILGGERPAPLLLPAGVDLSEPLPLILLLHGYGSDAVAADQYFGFSFWVDEGRFGLLLPDGTADEDGERFWNATPACCDLYGTQIDDVGYLTALVAEAREHANFDRLVAVGHSNGGFMAYRLACEAVPGLAGVVSLAGMPYADGAACRVPTPLSVLHIHGTLDDDVRYEGGPLGGHPDPELAPPPGAVESVTRWAERAGCDTDAVQELPPLDTDTAVEGAETSIHRITEGCQGGVTIELWTIHEGGHIPLVWETQFSPGILTWLRGVYLGEETALVPG